ncbi:UDP-glucose 4-epimerase [Parasteatoda tepidariorum]|uniref:UDP-glucose 4-epimerase n=1 Tax=Parasteatoda tepidariorum TaxID=114398 RepID=UPI00077FA4A3|nr:UDP-glucose 4-epimerase [Parasteatoda tepidariorum]XP_042910657.1 UDP-glucose 4-epimerase [Parasteatoda tepidariorum]XP_042910658.1 UDP-glucose 4-epimerase [Parasteatoda tepidariorum]
MSSVKEYILVTGGAGYVGSHSILVLLQNNYNVVAIDNFSNSSPSDNNDMPESLRRVQNLAEKTLIFYQIDLLNKEALEEVFQKHAFSCVIHFAALKAVGESCRVPLDYYRNNVGGTVNLLEVMKNFKVKRFVFSSSATVYGKPEYLPIDENHSVGSTCTNPYGRTKYFIEEILKDLCSSDKDWTVTLLRYFNPVGAHESGEIGEDPQGIPNNLMPYLSQVAVGRLKELQVFGNDYKTVDGTGVRDYIHVMDLAEGHVAAVKEILERNEGVCKVYNLGSGEGYSVLQVIQAFDEGCGVKIPYKIVGRREGDVDSIYADASLAEKRLGWKAKRTLKEMCQDTWRWQSKNPKGYRA